MAKAQPHKRLVNACLQVLATRRVLAWENKTGGRKIQRPDGTLRWLEWGKKGSADIIGCMPNGRFLAVECKVGRDKLSPGQATFLADVLNHKGFGYVAEDNTDGLLAELDATLGVRT